MRFVYFSIPSLGADFLPDDANQVVDIAMRYKTDKAKMDNFMQRFTGKPVRSLGDRVNGAINDVGAGVGVGLTAAGAELRNYKGTRGLGTRIKQHGIRTLMEPNLQKLYGIGVPTAIVGGTGLAAKAGYDALTSNREEPYSSEYE